MSIRRKLLLTAAKLLLAALLLAGVLSRVHWGDYVVLKDGSSGTIRARSEALDSGTSFTIATGHLWWADTKTVPADEVTKVEDADGDTHRRSGLATTFRGIRPLPLVGSVLGFLVSMLLVAVRWRVLLRVQDVEVTVWEVIQLTFLGQFYNTVVPGTVGGDLVKAFYAAKHTPHKAAVMVSVVLDRAVGLLGLTCMAALMLALVLAARLETFTAMRTPALCVAVVTGLVLAGLLFLLGSRLRRALHLQKLYSRLPFAKHIEAAGAATAVYRRNPGKLAGALGLTFCAHLGLVSCVACAGISLSLPAAWYSYLLYVPLIYIIGAVPITPGSMGVLEHFYLLFFAAAGCAPSMVLALALLARLVPIACGLPGIYVAVAGHRPPATDQMQAELGMAEQESA